MRAHSIAASSGRRDNIPTFRLLNMQLQQACPQLGSKSAWNRARGLTTPFQPARLHTGCKQTYHRIPSNLSPAPSTVAHAAFVDVTQPVGFGPSDAADEDFRPNPISDEFDWFDHWYPVAFVKDLDRSKPHRFVLLDIPLVIWWDANASAWRVFEDVCPHRLVPLSEGRINKSGHLECGYHGWEFSASGKCEVVPQQGNKDTPRACATAYHAAVRQGLLYVLPRPLPPALGPGGSANGDLGEALAAATEAEARIPLIEEIDQPGWVVQDVWRDLPYDYSTLMENVLDSSHVPFTHHASMSNRNNIGAFDIRLTSPLTQEGFTGIWKTGPRAGKLGPQSTRFTAPMLMKHRIDGNGFASITVVYAVPISPGKCRVINRNGLMFGNNKLPGMILRLLPPWLMHVQSHTLLEDDQIFLHLGEEELARRRAAGLAHSQVCYMPAPADTYVVTFNRWLQRFGGGGPFGAMDAGFVEALGPRLSREALLDRYSSHTAHCATCQAGLKQVGAAQHLAKAITVAAGSLAVLCAAVAVAAATTGAAAAVPAALAADAAGSVAGALGEVLVRLGLAVTGPVDGSGVGPMVRAAAWAAVALTGAVVGGKLRGLEQGFFKGVYPPPRNLKD